MEVQVVAGGLGAASTDALVLFVSEGGTVAAGRDAADAASNGLVGQVLATGDFKAQAGDVKVLFVPGSSVKRIILAGLGKPGAHTREALRNASGKAALAARELGAQAIALAIPTGLSFKAGEPATDAEAVAQAVAEGALLSQYQLHTYRTQDLDDVKAIAHMTFLADADADAAGRGVETARVLTDAIAEVRRLILAPANYLDPQGFAEEARTLGTAAGLTVKVIGHEELAKRGFGALIGVGQGSVKPPVLFEMHWNGGTAGEAPLALVGKGITFDSGGIGIKPGAGMEKMKYDMGGGGAVVGAMLAIAKLGLKRNVVGVVAAAENMPSGTALKPGDVVKSYAGLTIEVNDTDAEGRVVLADALAYTVKDLKAEAIVDMATLTGAVGVAIGLEMAGVMGNHKPFIDRVLTAGALAGEPGWHLPLEGYEDHLKSEIADLKNYGSRYGAASAAAAFLEKFVDGTPWVHLDIAGVGWTDKDKGYRPKGPTGAPVRLLVELVKGWDRL